MEEVAERDELRPEALRPDRVAPGPLDVTEHRQGRAVGVRQQPLRQRRDERPLGDRPRPSASVWAPRLVVDQEGVERRRAGAVAGEVEGDHPMHEGVVGDVGGGQVMLRPHRAETRPVLAEQRPLRRGLPLVPHRPAHAMRRGEEERRWGRASGTVEHLGEAGLRRVAGLQAARRVAEVGGDGRLRLLACCGGQALVQGRDEPIGAHLCGPVGQVAGAPVDDLARVGHGRRILVVHHALGVLPVLIGPVESHTSDGVLDVEQVLELERDCVGGADQQHVVGYLRRCHGPEGDAVSLEPVLQELARPVL